jgi:hypothetical protein
MAPGGTYSQKLNEIRRSLGKILQKLIKLVP